MGICIDTLRTWLQGCRWVRSAVPTGNSGVSGNWRRKSAPCASSLWRKMRSLTFKKTRRHPVQTIADKHRCAQTLHCQGTPVEQACRVLEISRSGYYGWAQHNPCARERRNQALRRRWVELHQNYPALGSLCHLLQPEFGCSRKRVHRQLRLAGIVSVRCRACKVTTNSRHSYPLYRTFCSESSLSASQIKPG